MPPDAFVIATASHPGTQLGNVEELMFTLRIEGEVNNMVVVPMQLFASVTVMV